MACGLLKMIACGWSLVEVDCCSAPVYFAALSHYTISDAIALLLIMYCMSTDRLLCNGAAEEVVLIGGESKGACWLVSCNGGEDEKSICCSSIVALST
jgi:hypothetical protein